MNSSHDNPKLLIEATVQEIQLELIRRTSFNLMHGPQVVAYLMEHHDLWSSVLLDRPGYAFDHGPPSFGLIKLRDLSGNFWNADTLYILCETAENAHRLAAGIEEEENWHGEVQIHENQEANIRALGTSEGGYIVTVWWD